MKNYLNISKLVSIATLSVISLTCFCQTDAIDYQTIITDIQNLPIKLADLEIRIEVKEATPNGSVSYTETHQATTNINGEVALEIGNGIPVNASFSDINWEVINYIELSVKPEGSSLFLSNGNTELLSVPYAIFATKLGCEIGCPGEDGEDGVQGAQGVQGPQGEQGPQGAEGPHGPQGNNALDGHQTLELTNIVPQNPVEGQFYLDDGSNRSDGIAGFRYYTSGNWINL